MEVLHISDTNRLKNMTVLNERLSLASSLGGGQGR